MKNSLLRCDTWPETSDSNLIPDPFFADLHNADRIDNAIRWRHRQSSLGHQLAEQGRSLGPRDSGLNTEPHEAFGIVERLPGMPGDFRDERIRVAAPFVARIQLRAVIDEHLDHFRTALRRCNHQ